MSHLKNYRGATNYFNPSTPDYRNNYDRIFGRKDDSETTCPRGEHEFESKTTGPGEITVATACKRCGKSLVDR